MTEQDLTEQEIADALTELIADGRVIVNEVLPAHAGMIPTARSVST